MLKAANYIPVRRYFFNLNCDFKNLCKYFTIVTDQIKKTEDKYTQIQELALFEYLSDLCLTKIISSSLSISYTKYGFYEHNKEDVEKSIMNSVLYSSEFGNIAVMKTLDSLNTVLMYNPTALVSSSKRKFILSNKSVNKSSEWRIVPDIKPEQVGRVMKTYKKVADQFSEFSSDVFVFFWITMCLMFKYDLQKINDFIKKEVMTSPEIESYVNNNLNLSIPCTPFMPLDVTQDITAHIYKTLHYDLLNFDQEINDNEEEWLISSMEKYKKIMGLD